MSNQTRFNASPALTPRDPLIARGLPMRGTLRERIQDEHLLQRQESESSHPMTLSPRDGFISILGFASAMVPLVIAIQSLLGI